MGSLINKSSRHGLIWGVVFALLAAMWIYGAVNPSPGEHRLLFVVLGVFAAILSGVFLSEGAPNIARAVGSSVSIIFWLSMGFLVVAGILSFISGAPIPAAIIVGSLIIAAAITQSK